MGQSSSKNSNGPVRDTPVVALTQQDGLKNGQLQQNESFYEQYPVLPTANEGRGKETQQAPQEDQSTSTSKLVGGINLSLSPQPSSQIGKMVHETFHTKPPKVTNTISIVETHQPQSVEPKTTPPNVSAVGRAKLPNKPSELAIAFHEIANEPEQGNEAKGGSTGGNTGEQSFALAEMDQNEHPETCEDTTQTTTVCLEDIDSVIRTSKSNRVFVDSPNYPTAKLETSLWSESVQQYGMSYVYHDSLYETTHDSNRQLVMTYSAILADKEGHYTVPVQSLKKHYKDYKYVFPPMPLPPQCLVGCEGTVECCAESWECWRSVNQCRMVWNGGGDHNW